MDDKEHVYRERISPLIKQVYELAKELDIPFVALTQINESSLMSTAHLPEWAHQDLHLACIVGEEGFGATIYKVACATQESAVSMKLSD